MGNPISQGPSIALEMKYCADCGKQIPRTAEFCPHCGCRQLPPPRKDSSGAIGLVGRSLGTAVGAVVQPIVEGYEEKGDRQMEGQLEKELKGIGGWLTVFVVIIMVINPICEVVIISPFFSTLMFYLNDPYFSWSGSTSGVTGLMLILVCFGLFCMAIHIITGAWLLKGKPNALAWVKALIIIQIIMTCFATLMDNVQRGETLASGLPMLAIIGCWWIYFKFSHRVKNTYGRNL